MAIRLSSSRRSYFLSEAEEAFMSGWRLGVILIGVAGAAMSGGRVVMAGSPDLGVYDAGVTLASGVCPAGSTLACERFQAAQVVSAPIDPVIEEPLRSLFPDGQSLSPAEAVGCGAMGLPMLSTGLMLLAMTSLIRLPGRR